jgi:hypothetical protein
MPSFSRKQIETRSLNGQIVNQNSIDITLYGHKKKKKTTIELLNTDHGDFLERSHDQTCFPAFYC